MPHKPTLEELNARYASGRSGLTEYTAAKLGMDPNAKRKAFFPTMNVRKVPHPTAPGASTYEVTGWTAPEVLFSMAKSLHAPRAAAEGVPLSPKDVAEFATNFGVVGGGATQAGSTAEHVGTLGVVKPKGGNWLKSTRSSVESHMKRLKDASVPDVRLADAIVRNAEQVGIPVDEARVANIREVSPAMNEWIDTKLVKFIKNEMGTKEDRLRALAEEGVVLPGGHTAGPMIKEDAHQNRAMSPAGEVLGISPEARTYEDIVDAGLGTRKAELFNRYSVDEAIRKENPWLEYVPEDAPVHYIDDPSFTFNSGLQDLTQDMVQAMAHDSGLPERLRLKPTDLKRMSVPDAVKKMQEVRAWKAEQERIARAEQLERAGQMGEIVKEYPESGHRWVEYNLPTEDPGPTFVKPKQGGFVPIDAKGNEIEIWDPITRMYKPLSPRQSPQQAHLEGMLVTEGNLMGHCVGRYCDQVLGGVNRVFSLRDKFGDPLATIETRPGEVKMSPEGPLTGAEAVQVGIANQNLIPEYQEFFSLTGNHPMHFADMFKGWLEDTHPSFYEQLTQPGAPRLMQIKGRGNQMPADEALPALQDFVTSQPWSFIESKDAPNAGLRRAEVEFSPYELEKARAASVEIPEHGYMTGQQLQSVRNANILPEDLHSDIMEYNARGMLMPKKGSGYARGGAVRSLNDLSAKYAEGGIVDKISRGVRNAQFKLSDMIGLGPEVQFATKVPEHYFPASEQHNQRGDAMRHMLLQAQLMQKYGETPAKIIGWAHENLSGPQQAAEKEMDLYNDALGREIGRTAKDKDDMVKRALQAIESNKARTLSEEEMKGEYARGGAVRTYDPAAVDAIVNQF